MNTVKVQAQQILDYQCQHYAFQCPWVLVKMLTQPQYYSDPVSLNMI